MGCVAFIGWMRNKYKVFARKPKGRPRCTWEDNIKVDLKEVGRRWTGFSGLRTKKKG
jgi:hypothetical protein